LDFLSLESTNFIGESGTDREKAKKGPCEKSLKMPQAQKPRAGQKGLHKTDYYLMVHRMTPFLGL